MAKKKANKRATKTARRSSSELAPASWLDVLAKELKSEAEQWRGHADTSPPHYAAWLVLYSISQAIERTQISTSNVRG